MFGSSDRKQVAKAVTQVSEQVTDKTTMISSAISYSEVIYGLLVGCGVAISPDTLTVWMICLALFLFAKMFPDGVRGRRLPTWEKIWLIVGCYLFLPFIFIFYLDPMFDLNGLLHTSDEILYFIIIAVSLAIMGLHLYRLYQTHKNKEWVSIGPWRHRLLGFLVLLILATPLLLDPFIPIAAPLHIPHSLFLMGALCLVIAPVSIYLLQKKQTQASAPTALQTITQKQYMAKILCLLCGLGYAILYVRHVLLTTGLFAMEGLNVVSIVIAALCVVFVMKTAKNYMGFVNHQEAPNTNTRTWYQWLCYGAICLLLGLNTLPLWMSQNILLGMPVMVVLYLPLLSVLLGMLIYQVVNATHQKVDKVSIVSVMIGRFLESMVAASLLFFVVPLLQASALSLPIVAMLSAMMVMFVSCLLCVNHGALLDDLKDLKEDTQDMLSTCLRILCNPTHVKTIAMLFTLASLITLLATPYAQGNLASWCQHHWVFLMLLSLAFGGFVVSAVMPQQGNQVPGNALLLSSDKGVFKGPGNEEKRRSTSTLDSSHGLRPDSITGGSFPTRDKKEGVLEQDKLSVLRLKGG